MPPIEEILPIRDVKGSLSTRSFLAACERFQVPVHRMNRRVFVIKRSDYSLLLSRMSLREAA